jgi:ABC-type Fe3+/spermidine/putrescine transport system ATPase subunit
MPLLEIRNIAKSYQDQMLLDGITFTVENNETVCLLGPSGGGKSTILRIISGLENAERGQILWQGKDISDQPPFARHFGLMFQDYALFPHMTVFENVAFGLRMQKLPEQIIESKVVDILELVNMKNFIHRRVTALSGGEQQRVALARALAPKPHLLMLDEPLAALDRTLREKLGEELRGLLLKMKIPAIYVTHDQQEAFSIADRILVLNQGKIVQSGTPSDVYSRPASPWLATFFGLDNQIRGKIISVDPLKVSTAIGNFECACQNNEFCQDDLVVLVFKQTGAVTQKKIESKNLIEGRVIETIFSADRFKTKVAINENVNFEFLFEEEFRTDQAIRIWLEPDFILCFGNNV